MAVEIKREDVARLLADGAQLLEVLSRQAYEEEHIAGAVSLPLDEMNAKTMGQIQKERPVIVYCHDYE